MHLISKKLFFFLSLFSIVIFSKAQTTFIKTYKFAAPFSFQNVIKTNDNGYILSGYWILRFIAKTDSAGNLLWIKGFPTQADGAIMQVIQTKDGGLAMIGGSDTTTVFPYHWDYFLLHTDADGNPDWLKTYNAFGSEIATGVIEMSDSGYIISGGSNAAAYLVRTDKYGDTLWTKMIPSFGNSIVSCSAGDDQLILASEWNNTELRLIKINSSASEIWARNYQLPNAQIMSVLKTSDEGYIATGCIDCGGQNSDMFIFKSDSTGQLLWLKKYFSPKAEGGSTIIELPQNEFAITGFVIDTLDFGTFLIKINSAGDTLWTREFPLNSGGESMLSESDGGLIISAEHTLVHDSYMALVRTDELGNTTCISQPFVFKIIDSLVQTSSLNVIVASTNSVVETPAVSQSNITMYETVVCFDTGNYIRSMDFDENISFSPNPFHSQTTIRASSQLAVSSCQLKIYNTLGSLVRTEEIENIQSHILNRNEMHDGIYFYQVIQIEKSSEEIIGSGKFIID